MNSMYNVAGTGGVARGGGSSRGGGRDGGGEEGKKAKKKDFLNGLMWQILKHDGIAADAVKEAIESTPHLVRRSYGGCLPLHWVCRRFMTNGNRVSALETVVTMVDLYPEGLKVRDTNGNLPLHLACTYCQPLEIVQFLVSRHPDAVREKNGEGMVPLHLAYETPVAKFLLSLHPGAVLERDHEGKTPVHYYWKSRNAVTEMLVSERRDSVSVADDDGNTPLHLAASSLGGPRSLGFVELFASRCPEAARIRDRAGRLPLHHAVSSNADEDVVLRAVEALVRCYPRAARKVDLTKSTPLHLALDPRYISYPVVELLVRDCPDAIHIKDRKGRTCLALACNNDAPLKIVHLLVITSPENALSLPEDVTMQERKWPGREIKWHLSKFGW